MTNRSKKKKREILESATKVFSGKGFANATISEIAKGAGLTSSGIYLYYKSKEALLFTIIENFLIRSRSGLSEHLQGIQGAENKLRKAIWFHCKAYSGNKSEIKIVLEARSYPRFYKSTAYAALKQYAGMITGIIKEGIQEGNFSGVSPPMILRDMILGTVDHIAINWTLKNTSTSLDKAEKIYDLVMRAVDPTRKGKGHLDKKSEKRERIVNSAISLFAEKGLNDTSMLEISQKADVAEGTVYEYFQNKENLLISIPREKLTRLYDTVSGNSLEKKIKSLIASIFEFYHHEKDYATILVLMLRTNKKFHKSKSNEIIEKLFAIIEETIVKGQAGNIFKKDLDLQLCRDLLFGTLDHIMIPWIIFSRCYDMRALGAEVSDLFINAIRA
jgi:TetR/AcrR family transcriptional regulator, fatty acid metabolism regulator protein